MADEKILGKYLKNMKGKWLLLLLAAVAVALLLLGGQGSKETNATTTTEENEAYRHALEAQLADLCEKVAGVSDVSLMLTLEGGERAVYAQDSTQNGAQDYVTVSGEGLLLYREYPTVRGVAVVCRGGDNTAARAELTALLSALLDVGSNRIYITGR